MGWELRIWMPGGREQSGLPTIPHGSGQGAVIEFHAVDFENMDEKLVMRSAHVVK